MATEVHIQLALWLVGDWTAISLNSFKFIAFAEQLCVCRGMSLMHRQAVYYFVFISCSLLLWFLKVSKQWWLRDFSGFSWACAQPYSWRWPSGVLGICWRFSMTLMTSHPPKTLLSFLVSFLFASTIITTSGSWNVKQLLVIIFDKSPGKKLFVVSELWVRY